MWFHFILVYCILTTTDCFNYNEATEDLLSKFNLMNSVPLSKDIGKLRHFKEELSEFSKSVVPLGESFAKSLNESKADLQPISNLTSAIREKIIHLIRTYSMASRSYSFRYFVSNYDTTISRGLSGILFKLQLMTLDSAKKEDVDQLVRMCTDPRYINYKMEEMVGQKCLDFKFSQRAASVISNLIYSSKIATYELTIEEQEYFNELYSHLYFHLHDNHRMETSTYLIQLFIRDKKDTVYENKVKLLEDVSKLFDLDFRNDRERDCLPMTAFILHHFNSDLWLQIGDIIIGDIYASKFITRMCANITHYGNATAAEEYVLATEKKLGPVYTVISEWFDSLMESTWPTTETELISGFMKEASAGLPIPQNAAEYQKVANFVHDKMKSIGDPRYNRHYLVTKEYFFHEGLIYGSPRDFDRFCYNESCSQIPSVEAQCVTIRTEKNKAKEETNAHKHLNFTHTMKPKIMDSLESRYYINNDWDRGATINEQLRWDPEIDIWFRNHSTYVYIHSSKYWRNCEVFYGFKSEEGEEQQSVQLIHYHNNGTLFTYCHDALLLFGI